MVQCGGGHATTWYYRFGLSNQSSDWLVGVTHKRNNTREHSKQKMPRPKSQPETLTIGQLAKRWNIGWDRARRLADPNVISGTFTIPAAGRYGKAVRIPLASVLLAEQEWAESPEDNRFPNRPQRHQRNGHSPKLKHFPELQAEPGDAAECPEDDLH